MSLVDQLYKALAEGAVIFFIGKCRVNYEGRAASRLGEGERIIIVKKDKSVLVHRPTGYEPVNWQPPGSKLEFQLKGEGLLIRASNQDELLLISFDSKPEVEFFYLKDEAEFEMYASEEDMKRAVKLYPELIEEGFKPYEEEKAVGGFGRIDLLGVDRDGRLVVVEFKRKPATKQDILQLVSYLRIIENELGRKARGILAAPSLTKSARSEIAVAGLEFKCLSPRKCMEVLRKSRGLDAYL